MRDIAIITTQEKATNCCKILMHHTTKDTVDVDPYVTSHHYSVNTYVVINPDNGLVKIGRSTNYKHRIKGLSNEAGCQLSIIKIIDGDVEKLMHERYKEYAVGREWFCIPNHLLTELKSITKGVGEV